MPFKWAHLDSNQGPIGYEPTALTAELWALSDAAAAGSTRLYVKRQGVRNRVGQSVRWRFALPRTMETARAVAASKLAFDATPFPARS